MQCYLIIFSQNNRIIESRFLKNLETAFNLNYFNLIFYVTLHLLINKNLQIFYHYIAFLF